MINKFQINVNALKQVNSNLPLVEFLGMEQIELGSRKYGHSRNYESAHNLEFHTSL